MYLHFTPAPVQWAFPRYTWHRSRTAKTIYLTFDDGPVPEVTPFVLDVLEQFNAKATFFCVGDNVRKHPEILNRALAAGHQVGNHTFNHLKGSKTGKDEYLLNVQQCTDEIKSAGGTSPGLFRPPYGRIRKEQAKALLPHYEMIMWDVLSADYDQSLSAESCLRKSIRYTKNGSIVVFHDNPKAFGNLSLVLPRYLQHFTNLGYAFQSL
ncbi:polysaccharide deacetylase family protein [Nafulsella turpanensis]|uniref:polysaccharide deacetylase family protein n=1 Tax=Nafulsella turpanensis TaxID=1265690 RepID=UPI0003478452|nr:polysaccharide deacetylase family protein [Nafulsella turpanensis]